MQRVWLVHVARVHPATFHLLHCSTGGTNIDASTTKKRHLTLDIVWQRAAITTTPFHYVSRIFAVSVADSISASTSRSACNQSSRSRPPVPPRAW